MKAEFNEHYEDKEGYVLNFSFQGKTNKKENIANIKKLLSSFKNENIIKSNILRNVVILKTIFKDCHKDILNIELKKASKEEKVIYIKDKLGFYEYEDKDIKIKYKTYIYQENNIDNKEDITDKLDVSFKNNNSEILLGKYPYTKTIKNKFNLIVDLINNLSEAKEVVLKYNEKILIQVYKLFYDRNPDFTKESINREIQAMAIILVQFGIDLGDYSFQVLHSGKRPTSLVLENIIYNLYPLGEVPQVINPIILDKKIEEKIKIIGNEIRSKFLVIDEYTLISLLSKLIYAGRYNLANTNQEKIETLANNVYCSKKEVEDCIKLVKKIDAKLNNY